MKQTIILKSAVDAASPRRSPGYPQQYAARRGTPAGTALWLFMGVATSLFSLFILAYAMRMDGADWSAIALPWQLWLSTGALIGASVALQRAAGAAREMWWTRARTLLLAGGAGALAFLAAQIWGWQALIDMRVTPAGNPAASFFFLLTAAHGLHVAGGLAAWGITVRRARGDGAWLEPARTVQAIALCARYWHFLLAVWVVLFGVLGWLTPALINFICGRS